jgi:glycosyltransferase involved in cell wall biosynthesis
MNPICIIIPFYNEAGRFPADEFLGFLQKDPETSFCLVNDGSTDDTGRMLESLRERSPDRILVTTLPENKGKSGAVQAGMISALQHFNCRYYGFFDADLSTRLEESFRLRSRLMEKPSLEYAFGSRVAILGVRIERKLYRHLIGRVIATFISGILHLMVYDTQCGAKLFTRPLATRVFEKPFITRWLFDVEILARIIGMYGRDRIGEVVMEVPVESWIDKGGSKVSWSYGFRVLYDLMRIRNHYKAFL